MKTCQKESQIADQTTSHKHLNIITKHQDNYNDYIFGQYENIFWSYHKKNYDIKNLWTFRKKIRHYYFDSYLDNQPGSVMATKFSFDVNSANLKIYCLERSELTQLSNYKIRNSILIWTPEVQFLVPSKWLKWTDGQNL